VNNVDKKEKIALALGLGGLSLIPIYWLYKREKTNNAGINPSGTEKTEFTAWVEQMSQLNNWDLIQIQLPSGISLVRTDPIQINDGSKGYWITNAELALISADTTPGSTGFKAYHDKSKNVLIHVYNTIVDPNGVVSALYAITIAD
jgi:hypothetical protein